MSNVKIADTLMSIEHISIFKCFPASNILYILLKRAKTPISTYTLYYNKTCVRARVGASPHVCDAIGTN